MGMFDTIHTGDRCGQTKAFDCLLSDLTPGDEVNRADSQYAMRDGGWLIVKDARIVAWVDEPDAELPRYDSYAERIHGEVPDGYCYTVPTREQTAERAERLNTTFNRGPVTDAQIDEMWASDTMTATGLPGYCTICAQLRAGLN